MEITYHPNGDKAVLIRFKQEISEKINNQVIAFTHHLEEKKIPGITEWVPTYVALMIHYNPLVISYHDLIKELKELHPIKLLNTNKSSIIHDIPVLYGGKWGPDLQDIADYNHLTMEEVIKIHSSTIYRVYMLGFIPGFPYLGGLDSRIQAPRLKNPRLEVLAGSVGIAGQQTGIYPLTSPGGWRIIGHTPFPLFQADSPEEPVRILAGDSIKFVPVNEEEYSRFKEKMNKNI